jgi:ABC-2 type transport system permease protein
LINRSLLKKSVIEARLLFVACAAALYAFCWARVWMVSLFEMSRFQTIVEQFREFERFSPVPFEQLFTYPGRIAMAYDEPVVVVSICMWAIARGSDCISGELGRGTMEMLLAQPVSRVQVLWSQAAVTISGVVLLAATSWLGIYTGIATTSIKEPAPAPTWTIPWLDIQLPNPLAEEELVEVPMAFHVDQVDFVPAAFNLMALGFFLAGLTTLCSALDRYRWRTIGIVAGFCIVQVIVKVIGLAADHLNWLGYLSFFSAYEPERFVSAAINSPEQTWNLVVFDTSGAWVGLGPLGYSLVLIGMGLAAYLAATFIFRARDLPAPL